MTHERPPETRVVGLRLGRSGCATHLGGNGVQADSPAIAAGRDASRAHPPRWAPALSLCRFFRCSVAKGESLRPL